MATAAELRKIVGTIERYIRTYPAVAAFVSREVFLQRLPRQLACRILAATVFLAEAGTIPNV
jgi:hypothetical protein